MDFHRLRREHAAWLCTSDRPVTVIALEAGHETHEAFTRAFGGASGWRRPGGAARPSPARPDPAKPGRPAADPKQRFYRMARRSATETAAILDVLARRQAVTTTVIRPARDLIVRVVSMLVRLAST